MRNIWRIFTDNLRSLRSNVIAMIVVIGLLITPPLYAWFNILGFWDPYSKTDNLEVAVANSDRGYQSDLFPTKVNAGEDVVSALRADNEFKWVFTDENEAISGVESGKYYAALVIPEQFSANLLAIFSGKVEQADIIYYTNQKENAVAPKVTEEGANQVSVAINQAFTKAVTGVALNTTSELAGFVNGDGVANYGRNLTGRLGQVVEDLRLAADEAKAFANLVNATAGVAETATTVLEELGGVEATTGPFLDQMQGGFDQGMQALAAANNQLGQLAGQLDQLEGEINQKFDGIDAPEVSAVREDLNNKIQAARSSLTDYQNQVNERLNQLSGTLSSDKAAILSTSQGLKAITTDLGGAAGSLATNLRSVAEALTHTESTLTGAAERLSQTEAKLQAALDAGDLAEVREMLGQNSDKIAEFVSAPTELQRIPVYGIANNGSAFSPFYTSLSIWVGSVFMVALMETTTGKKRQAALIKAKPHQLYFGRYLTFLAFALLQATIVCFGDVFFLGIQCDNIGLFFLTGWVCALVFSNIVYTLTLSFGKVGECLAIILLVMQIAGSGGIFPVVLSAEFFQVLYPFLPFAYSLQAFQGAVAGVYGNQEVVSILMMLAFLLPMLLIGLILRKPIIKLNDSVVEKMGETGVM